MTNFCSEINKTFFDMGKYEKIKVADVDKSLDKFINIYLSSVINNRNILLYGMIRSHKIDNKYVEFIAMIRKDSKINIYSEKFNIIENIKNKQYNSIELSSKTITNYIVMKKLNKIESYIDLNSDNEDKKQNRIKDFLNYIIVKTSDFETDDIEFKFFVKNYYDFSSKYDKYDCIYNRRNEDGSYISSFSNIKHYNILKKVTCFSDTYKNMIIYYNQDDPIFSINDLWKFYYYRLGIYDNYQYEPRFYTLFDGEIDDESNDLHVKFDDRNELMQISHIVNFYNESFKPINNKKITIYNKLTDVEKFISTRVTELKTEEKNGWNAKILTSYISNNTLILLLIIKQNNNNKYFKIISEKYTINNNYIKQEMVKINTDKFKDFNVLNFINSLKDNIDLLKNDINSVLSIYLIYDDGKLYDCYLSKLFGSLSKLNYSTKIIDKNNPMISKYKYEVFTESIINTKHINNKCLNTFTIKYIQFLYSEILKI